MWRPDQEWLDMVSQETYEALRDTWLPELPPIEGGAYLVGYLMAIGPTLSGGMGPVPITFSEIDAWCNRTGIDLLPFEAELLKRLSNEYLGESQKASKHFAPAPWTKPEEL